MTKLEIKGTGEAIAAIEEIFREMIQLFDMPSDEAYGRINREFSWREQGFYDDDGLLLLTHEDPFTWAMNIYFGRESLWWLSESRNLTPVPYP